MTTLNTYTVSVQITLIEADGEEGNTDMDFETFEASSDKQALAIAPKKYNGKKNGGTEDYFLETLWAGDINFALNHPNSYLEQYL